MAQKGYISEFMNGGRIVSHGKIESLSQGFKLPNDTPFSVYIRPKDTASEALDTVLSVKCYQDERFSDAPIAYNDWSPMAIVEIAPDMEILGECDIYWGSGSWVEQV
jgi:hypothetical protein